MPIWGLTQRLRRRVGTAKALEMMYASRTYSGSEAVAMGLCNFCVPDDQLDSEADRFCRDILSNSWRSSRVVKKLVADTDGLTLAAGIAWELHHSPGHGPEMLDRIARARNKYAPANAQVDDAYRRLALGNAGAPNAESGARSVEQRRVIVGYESSGGYCQWRARRPQSKGR